jgi:hypothetical protein
LRRPFASKWVHSWSCSKQHRPVDMVSVLAVLGGLLAVVLLAVLVVLGTLMRAMDKAFHNIQVGPPTPALLRKFDQSKSQLFRYLPELRGKIAWVDMGASFPTAVHQVTLEVDTPAGKTQISFALKREDMCSRVYGGACALFASQIPRRSTSHIT